MGWETRKHMPIWFKREVPPKIGLFSDFDSKGWSLDATLGVTDDGRTVNITLTLSHAVSVAKIVITFVELWRSLRNPGSTGYHTKEL